MGPLYVDSKTTALLVMDCQEEIVNSLIPQEKEKLLINLNRAIKAARLANIPVIYVVVRFREGYPEVSERNKRFSEIKEANRLKETRDESWICKELTPRPEDVIITKKRTSAFSGSDLEILLRAMKIDTLVLTGVSSLGVVESTARFAVDMDYKIVIISDCCSDRVPKAHDIAMKWLLPRVGTVCSVSDFESATSAKLGS